MCLLPSVRSLALCVAAVLNEFVSVGIFLVSTMIFFAWVAVTIFDDLDGVNNYGVPVNTGLDNFGAACYTMFVAGTTDDFVNAFLPSFIAYRQAGILWLVFLVIVQLLFHPLATLVAFCVHLAIADDVVLLMEGIGRWLRRPSNVYFTGTKHLRLEGCWRSA